MTATASQAGPTFDPHRPATRPATRPARSGGRLAATGFPSGGGDFRPGPARRLPGERIAAAAIIDPRSGRIVEGACHGDAMAAAGIRWEDITPDLADWIAAHEGFTTTFGRFVTREAAAAIARASGLAVDGPLTSEQFLGASASG